MMKLLTIAGICLSSMTFASTAALADCRRCYTAYACGPINPGVTNCTVGPDYRNQRRCVNLGTSCTIPTGMKQDYKKEGQEKALAACGYPASANQS